MKRICPECSKQAIKVRMLSFTRTMYCENCFHQYKYTTGSKLFLSLVFAFIPTTATILGLVFKSWVLFGLILILSPFAIEVVFAKYCSLKPVGLRSKLQLNEKNIEQNV